MHLLYIMLPFCIKYCFLIANKEVCCRVHMHDLKDVTNNVHYENFRYSHLATVTSEGQKAKTVTTSKCVILSVCHIYLWVYEICHTRACLGQHLMMRSPGICDNHMRSQPFPLLSLGLGHLLHKLGLSHICQL